LVAASSRAGTGTIGRLEAVHGAQGPLHQVGELEQRGNDAQIERGGVRRQLRAGDRIREGRDAEREPALPGLDDARGQHLVAAACHDVHLAGGDGVPSTAANVRERSSPTAMESAARVTPAGGVTVQVALNPAAGSGVAAATGPGTRLTRNPIDPRTAAK